MVSGLLERLRRTKPGTKAYIVCVALLPWAAFYPISTDDRDIVWYALPISGPPLALAYGFLSRSTQFVWPNIVAYYAYFALVLLPLCLYLNTRNAPIGRTLVWATVALAIVTHAALTFLAYQLWNA